MDGILYVVENEIGLPLKLLTAIAADSVEVVNCEDREQAFKLVERWDEQHGGSVDEPDAER